MTADAGLYVHIPFCSAVCPYCDFVVQVGDAQARAAYVAALMQEIKLWEDWKTPIDTIYFGGGTPSMLDEAQLARLIETARARLPLRPQVRLHFEANPEDVTEEAVLSWRRLGVHFLSLGVQSFDADELRQLGRRHTPEEAERAVALCLDAGFPTVSVDLMFGLPRQDIATWRRNLQRVMAFGPGHVSCYQLTIHEGTTFGRWKAAGKLSELGEDEQGDFFELTHASLAEGGYEAYEVSNFARTPEHRSRHNSKYWQHVPYLGVGVSAHSFDGQRRWWNRRGVSEYTGDLASALKPVSADETLTVKDLALEALMLGLRTSEGIDLAGYASRYGVNPVERHPDTIRSLTESGLISVENGQLAPTIRGMAVADGIAARLSAD